MLLVSWNLAGRVRQQPAQAATVLGQDAEVVCLQELTPTTRPLWEDSLRAEGYDVALSAYPVAPTGLRRLSVCIAARGGVTAAGSLPIPWPERHLAAVVCDRLIVHTLHAPLSSKAGRVKARTLEALYGALAPDDGTPRVLTGDLNTPRYESRDGEIATFARTQGGAIRPDYGEDHDRAELRLIQGLPELGWRDAFRSLHGYERRDRSWKSFGPGYRLDHVIVSPQVALEACDYLHEWREDGLSDHSGMFARIVLPPPG